MLSSMVRVGSSTSAVCGRCACVRLAPTKRAASACVLQGRWLGLSMPGWTCAHGDTHKLQCHCRHTRHESGGAPTRKRVARAGLRRGVQPASVRHVRRRLAPHPAAAPAHAAPAAAAPVAGALPTAAAGGCALAVAPWGALSTAVLRGLISTWNARKRSALRVRLCLPAHAVACSRPYAWYCTYWSETYAEADCKAHGARAAAGNSELDRARHRALRGPVPCVPPFTGDGDGLLDVTCRDTMYGTRSVVLSSQVRGGG